MASWAGGRIHIGKDGRKHYYLWKKLGGREFKFALGTNEKIAFAELRRWELDPLAYVPPGKRVADATVAGDGAVFDAELIMRFLVWSGLSKKEGGKENTVVWVNQQRLHLMWWLKALGNVDLRRLTPKKILDAAEGTGGRAHKLRVLSSFYSWLQRRQQVVSIAENPFASKVIDVPQAQPSELVKPISYETFTRVLERLQTPEIREGASRIGNRNDHWAAVLLIQAGTGWHASEVKRFAESGWIEPLPEGAEPDAAGVIVTVHKSKRQHRTRVATGVLAAAEWLKERTAKAHGHTFDVRRYAKAVKAASEAEGLEVFTPRVIRSSVATWAVNRGESIERVSQYLGHLTKQTTRVWYAKLASAAKVSTLGDRARLRLVAGKPKG
jgi:integrase